MPTKLDSLHYICAPLTSQDAAIAEGKRQIVVNGLFDVELFRELRRLHEEYLLDEATTERIIRVLDSISPGRRTLLALDYLIHSPGQQLRSKAASFIVNTDTWTQNYLRDPDPRARAEVIKALWDSKSAEAAGHLAEASTILLSMAEHADPQFRVSAIWAMGQIGDDRFLEPLRKALQDEVLSVRSRAVRSLIDFRLQNSKKSN